MAHKLNRLSAVSLTKLRLGLTADGGGLYLQTSETEAGGRSWSWVFRYMLRGKARAMGLGSLQTINLAEARVKARAARQLLLDKVDPIETRNDKRAGELLATAKTLTFRECAEAYISAHRAGWSTKHAKQWPSTLATYAYPIIGSLPITAVDRPAVLRVLSPIWTEKPETASRVRGRLEAILGWAEQHGYRPTGINSATWGGALEHALPPKRTIRRVKHFAALAYTELPAFMAELGQQEGIAARALKFTILTAARTGETTGATWSEIDLDAHIWTLPPGRMKNKREHKVPLSDAALEILTNRERKSNRVFSISADVMLKLLKRLRPGFTVHGLRSSFRDFAAERTSHPREVAEISLAHTIGNAVERAYMRTSLFDRRRELMEAWSIWCAGGEHDNVIPIRGGERS